MINTNDYVLIKHDGLVVSIGTAGTVRGYLKDYITINNREYHRETGYCVEDHSFKAEVVDLSIYSSWEEGFYSQRLQEREKETQKENEMLELAYKWRDSLSAEDRKHFDILINE